MPMEIIYQHFETIPSTNDWAKTQLKTLSKDTLLLVTADMQTAGRGRYGKKWISPKGENLYATFGFLTDQAQDPLTLTQLLAECTSKVLKKNKIDSYIKWPNDLMVDQKKIAGILCETEPLPHHFGIAIGIGLNVNMPLEVLATVGQPATSLFAETGQKHDPRSLLSNITSHFLNALKY